jgi:hypothetical protein
MGTPGTFFVTRGRGISTGSNPAWGAHHDVEFAPSGDLSYLRFALIPVPSGDLQVLDCDVVRATPSGQITRTLSLFGALTENDIGFSLLPRNIRWNDRDITDLFHANSVEWMKRPELVGRSPIYDLGNVLVSIRHQDSVVILNGDRRELVWAWGQGMISGPHDASTLDNGNILIFDNGVNREWSRAIEVDPIENEIVWEYRGNEKPFTRRRGSAQRLPNGNTLLAISDAGQLLEVTPKGEVVWEYLNPERTAEGKRWHFARARRYETSFIDPFFARVRCPAPLPAARGDRLPWSSHGKRAGENV